MKVLGYYYYIISDNDKHFWYRYSVFRYMVLEIDIDSVINLYLRNSMKRVNLC